MTTALVWQHRLAMLGCALWLAAMIWLSATSANPPVVSRPQVLSAKAVVTGVLKLHGAPRVVVAEVLWSRVPLAPKDFPADGLPLPTVKGRWAKDGVEVVVPLEEAAPGRFRVQPIPFEMTPPADADHTPIYPATGIVMEQIEPLRPKR
jgi:hypothetical protein